MKLAGKPGLREAGTRQMVLVRGEERKEDKWVGVSAQGQAWTIWRERGTAEEDFTGNQHNCLPRPGICELWLPLIALRHLYSAKSWNPEEGRDINFKSQSVTDEKGRLQILY